MRERLHVKVDPSMIAGVKVYIATPESVLREHRDKVLSQGGTAVARCFLRERQGRRRRL